MRTDWLKLVTWLSTSNQSAFFQRRLLTYATLKFVCDIDTWLVQCDQMAILIICSFLMKSNTTIKFCSNAKVALKILPNTFYLPKVLREKGPIKLFDENLSLKKLKLFFLILPIKFWSLSAPNVNKRKLIFSNEKRVLDFLKCVSTIFPIVLISNFAVW